MFSASLSGDFGKLNAIGKRVASLGEPAAFREIAQSVGKEALELVDKGFARESDPYGVPWYRKSYPDGRSILQGASGKLRKSFQITYVSPDAVTVGSGLARALFAQGGTGLYGPTKARIRAKGKAMRFTGSNGSTLFRRSVKGQQQRRMLPVKWMSSAPWNRAINVRIKAVFGVKLRRI